MGIYAMAPTFPANLAKVKVESEPRYHTQWKTEKIDQKTLKQWGNAKPAEFMAIPKRNQFLPKHLRVTPNLMKTPPKYPSLPQPSMLVNNAREQAHIWSDNMFGDPFVTGEITMKTDKNILEKAGVNAMIQSTMLVACLNHAIVPKLHSFFEAGLTWSLGVSKGTNLVLSFSGANPVPKHYQAVMRTLAGYVKQAANGQLGKLIDAGSFESLKTSTLHALQNSLKGSPTDHALQKLRHDMVSLAFPTQDQIAAVKRVKFDDIIKFAPKLFKRTHFTGFFSGQIKPHDAKKTWRTVVDILTKSKTPLPLNALQRDRMRLLPNFPTYSQTHGSFQGNAAVLLIDAGGLNCKEREALAILYKAIPNHFYSELRTKQQTGYLVQTFPAVLVSHHNVLYFLVQSTKYLPGDLLKRFQAFITATLKDLQSGKSKIISQKDFMMIRGAKLAAYKTPNQNVKSMTGLMQTLLENYNGDFRTMEKKKALTAGMTYKDVLDVGAKVFAPSNKRQLAVVYTTDKVKMDKLPAYFKPFTKKLGKMVGKSHFKCPVKLAGSVQPTKNGKGKSHEAAASDIKQGKIKAAEDATEENEADEGATDAEIAVAEDEFGDEFMDVEGFDED